MDKKLRPPDIESKLDPNLDLTPEQIDAKLTEAGFNVAGLGASLAKAAEGAIRRRKARESLEKVRQVMASVQSGLRGPVLIQRIESIRSELEPQSAIWRAAAFRSRKGESEADEAEILDDLATLAELLRRQESDAGD